MRLLKLFAWESAFLAQLDEKREAELDQATISIQMIGLYRYYSIFLTEADASVYNCRNI